VFLAIFGWLVMVYGEIDGLPTGTKSLQPSNQRCVLVSCLVWVFYFLMPKSNKKHLCFKGSECKVATIVYPPLSPLHLEGKSDSAFFSCDFFLWLCCVM
jgi:hypothetical protein